MSKLTLTELDADSLMKETDVKLEQEVNTRA